MWGHKTDCFLQQRSSNYEEAGFMQLAMCSFLWVKFLFGRPGSQPSAVLCCVRSLLVARRHTQLAAGVWAFVHI